MMDDNFINAYVIADNIRNLRISNNLTQEEFANSIHFGLRTIKRYEAGDIDSLKTINEIANYFGVDVKSILFRNDD